jgi:hypothetical protein
MTAGGLTVTSTLIAVLGLFVLSGSTAGASLLQNIPDNADAGYFTNGLAPLSASTSFVVPSFTCTDVQQDIIVIEVNWNFGNSAIDEVLIGCSAAGAAATYSTLVEAPGATAKTTLAVSPGDRLNASAAGTSTKSTASLVDTTTKAKVTSVGSPETTGGINAVFILSRNALDATTPTFGTLTFKAMTVDGSPLVPTSSFTEDMTSASSVVQVRARTQSNAGTGTLSFQHS